MSDLAEKLTNAANYIEMRVEHGREPFITVGLGLAVTLREAAAELARLEQERSQDERTHVAALMKVCDDLADMRTERDALQARVSQIQVHAVAACEREGFGIEDTDDMVAIRELCAEVLPERLTAPAGEGE
jgi:hypothetical protein